MAGELKGRTMDGQQLESSSVTGGPRPRTTAVAEAAVEDEHGQIAAGATLDRYLLLNKLSESRSATIYMAHDIRLARDVALKCPPAASGSEFATVRIREAQALARVRTPHVVTLYTSIDSPAGPVLVLEYLVGQNLAQRLQTRQRISIPEVLELFEQALVGLESVHRSGIVHGNLKPDNLFLTTDRSVKLLDFRLAGFAESRGSRPDLRLGDLLYGAPEQVNGHEPDTRSDLYSLGLCLHEALTGRLPFADASTAKRACPLPVSLHPIVEKAIQHAPEERYQSAREFREALIAARPHTARHWRRRRVLPKTSPATPAAQIPAREPAPRAHRWLRSLTVDVALLAALLVLVWGLGLHPFQRSRPAAAEVEIQPTMKDGGRRPDTGQGHGERHKRAPDKYQDLRQAWGS